MNRILACVMALKLVPKLKSYAIPFKIFVKILAYLVLSKLKVFTYFLLIYAIVSVCINVLFASSKAAAYS